MVQVPAHMGIDGNEVADKMPRPGCSHPLMRPEPVLSTSAKVTMGVFRDGTCRKYEEHWQSIHGRKKANGFLKTLCKKRRGIAQSEQKPAKKIDRA